MWMMDVDFPFRLTRANGSFGVQDKWKVSWPVSWAADTSPPPVCRTKRGGRALSCQGIDRGSRTALIIWSTEWFRSEAERGKRAAPW